MELHTEEEQKTLVVLIITNLIIVLSPLIIVLSPLIIVLSPLIIVLSPLIIVLILHVLFIYRWPTPKSTNKYSYHPQRVPEDFRPLSPLLLSSPPPSFSPSGHRPSPLSGSLPGTPYQRRLRTTPTRVVNPTGNRYFIPFRN